MRRLIKDEKLLAVLGVIEEEIKHDIVEAEMSEEMAALYTCGVSRHEGQWLFLHETNRVYSDTTLFHELMHVILWIEGWPNYYIRQYYTRKNPEYHEKWRGLDKMAELAVNILQHPTIWQRGNQYGYSEMDEWNRQVSDDEMFSGHHTTEWEDRFVEEYLIGGQALHLAHAMLSPAALKLKSDLKRQAQSHLPKAFQIVEHICCVQEQLGKFFPESFDDARKKVFEATNMPQDILMPDPFDRPPPYPLFFSERILSVL
jgi:hypothetical protein